MEIHGENNFMYFVYFATYLEASKPEVFPSSHRQQTLITSNNDQQFVAVPFVISLTILCYAVLLNEKIFLDFVLKM